MICFAGNSNSSIVLTLILSVVTPNLSLNTYARASIVRFSESVVIVAARAPSSWSSGCLHWPWLSASLVPLSLFLGRNLFYIEFILFIFFLSAVHELEFFFPRRVRRVEVCVCANCHVGQGAYVLERVWVSVRAWREFFSFVYLPVYVRVWLSAHLSWRLFWNVRRSWRSFRVFDSQRHFPSYFSSFLSVLALGPTVILRVYSCLDLGPETGRLQHV